MKHFTNNGKEYLKMTEEDMKYRQGRSRQNVEGSYKAAAFSIIGIIVMLIIATLIS
tara:strand:+ start:551 stop:718 length:168 start_codon:yes stop_codon:yes gene_type:complete